MNEQRLVRKHRAASANFDVLEPLSGLTEVYMDGYASHSLSPSVIKTDFYVVRGSSQEKPEDGQPVQVEERVVTLRMVMPTVNFVEMCLKTLSSLKQQEAAIGALLDQHTESFKRLLREVDGVADPSKSQ